MLEPEMSESELLCFYANSSVQHIYLYFSVILKYIRCRISLGWSLTYTKMQSCQLSPTQKHCLGVKELHFSFKGWTGGHVQESDLGF